MGWDNSTQLSVLLLTEDSAKDARATLWLVLKKMFQAVEQHTQTHRIDLQPEDLKHRPTLIANGWKNRRARRQVVDLCQSIATTLLEESLPGFVVFHFDGDRAWAMRESCENTTKFADIIEKRVRALLDHHLANMGVDDDERASRVAQALTKLIPLVPFYSIESWLYQNTPTALRLCRESYAGRDVDRFEAWGADRALLDEQLKPKEETCLRDTHNAELAGAGFPTEDLYLVEKSFFLAVQAMEGCPQLVAALRQTSAT